MDTKWFKSRLRETGRTQEHIAEAIGRDRSVVSKILTGKHKFQMDFVAPFARVLDVPVSEILLRAGLPLEGHHIVAQPQGEGHEPENLSLVASGQNRLSKSPHDDAQPFQPVPVPQPAELKAFLPVYGSARGGNEDDGFFELNGQVIDRVKAPPALVGIRDAYGIYVQGSSMEPRYFEGELVYVHPHRPITNGCFAVIQLKPRHDGEPIRALVKRVVRKGHKVWELEQYNPAKIFPVQFDEILAVHRVLEGGELW